MKSFFIVLIAALLSSCASSGNSNRSSANSVGAGLKIDLPSGFDMQQFPMPIAGATNLRMTKSGLRLAITGIPFPRPGQIRTEDDLKRMLKESVDSQYRNFANESKANPFCVSSEGVVTCYESLSGKSGESFRAFPGAGYRYVTVAIASSTTGVLSITLASNTSDSDYAAVLLAIKGLHP
jgi:hypothetical protein